MANSSSSTVWERAREGQHIAVLGALPEHVPGDVQVFRVPCEMSRQTLGPILEVSRKAMALLDEKTPVPEGSAGGGWRGLRHRLLEDGPGRSQGMTVVEVLNRLQKQLGRPCVVIFEQVEAADMATLLMLREIVTHPGWLQAALVLVFHEPEPQGLAGQLLEAVRRSSGEVSVIRLAHSDNGSEKDAKAERDGSPPFAALPASVLRVLRVGAMMGPGFEAALIAQLLECSEVTVLEQLQQAYDLGVPIRDQGTGRFALPQATADKLMATLLPSLAHIWHRRLAELLSPESSAAPAQSTVHHGEENTPDDATSKGSSFVGEPESGRVERASTDEVTVGHGFDRAADSVPMPEFSGEAVDAQEPRSAVSVEPSSDEEEDPMAAAEAFARDMAEALAEESASWSPPPLEEDRPAPTELHGDARAAPHYMAVGEYDAAAQRYLQAAQEAASIGAHSQALHFAREALGLLENLPKSKPRRHLQIQLLTEMGRLQREAIGAHGDLSFSLREALETLEAAQKLLTEDDPVSLRAQVSSEIAQVCYDQGDQEALRRALDELTQASTWLREGGDPTSAVRLLNDQAAVWVRLGDPVRANRLLEHSLGFFQQQDRD
ncbi:MAG: hypothetical protein AAFS10_21315, partial [Myxococcota bacterium]